MRSKSELKYIENEIARKVQIELSYGRQITPDLVKSWGNKIAKTFSAQIEKGKPATMGEIREWSGKKYQKTAQGWKPVKGDKTPKAEEETSTNPKKEEETPNKKDHSDEELRVFAKETSTKDLEIASNGESEKLRIVAKDELGRRESEETVNKEPEDKNNDINALRDTILKEYRFQTKEAMDVDKMISSPEEYKKGISKKNSLSMYSERIERFSGINLEREKEKAKEFFELKTDNELQSMFGDGKIMGLKTTVLNKTIAAISCLMEDGFVSRTFNTYPGYNIENYIEMNEFLLNPMIEQGKGGGTNIFKNQVSQFKNLGYTSLSTDAARTEKYNGYYTWAVLGYEMEVDSQKRKFDSLVKESPNEKISSSKNLQELMSFNEGKRFWKENGFSFMGKFDLSDNSNSMKMLGAYIKYKKY